MFIYVVAMPKGPENITFFQNFEPKSSDMNSTYPFYPILIPSKKIF